jgi:hypothetical protein
MSMPKIFSRYTSPDFSKPSLSEASLAVSRKVVEAGVLSSALCAIAAPFPERNRREPRSSTDFAMEGNFPTH